MKWFDFYAVIVFGPERGEYGCRDVLERELHVDLDDALAVAEDLVRYHGHNAKAEAVVVSRHAWRAGDESNPPRWEASRVRLYETAAIEWIEALERVLELIDDPKTLRLGNTEVRAQFVGHAHIGIPDGIYTLDEVCS